jgi:hypothetical protein
VENHGPDFNPAALELGIEKCQDNIKIFEEAIEKERNTIKEYRIMIEQLAHKRHVMEVAEKGIRVRVERNVD